MIPFSQHIILIIASLFFMLVLLYMIHRRSFELRYSLLWLFVSMLFIIISIWPYLIREVADILFIESTMNALYLMMISAIITLLFMFTAIVSKISRTNRKLAQRLALQNHYINRDKRVTK